MNNPPDSIVRLYQPHPAYTLLHGPTTLHTVLGERLFNNALIQNETEQILCRFMNRKSYEDPSFRASLKRPVKATSKTELEDLWTEVKGEAVAWIKGREPGHPARLTLVLFEWGETQSPHFPRGP